MDFIDKLKQMGSETYKITTETTSKIAKETKLKVKISQNKSQIEDIYDEIGKAIYENHIREEKTDITEQIEEFCNKIDLLANEIQSIETEILDIKNKKKCNVCSTEMDKDVKFCPNCGKQQPEPPKAQEVEIVNEENENKQEEIKIEEENSTEDEIITPEFTENKNEQEEYTKEQNQNEEE